MGCVSGHLSNPRSQLAGGYNNRKYSYYTNMRAHV